MMVAIPGLGIAQELAPIQNFSPSEYNAESQNWAISQSKDKNIYVANSKGLLEFDGARWALYPSPNESIVRSVKVVEDRIYSGCYMEFGFWQKNKFGVLQYTSLSESIRKRLVEDEEFWGILDLEQWIAFQSHKRIYIYNRKDGSVNTIDSEAFLPKMFGIEGTIYFQKMGSGIYSIENGAPVLQYDEPAVAKDEVINIFQTNNRLLVLTRDNGFYTTNGKELVKWKTDADRLLSRISLYSALQLKNGGFALGTISNGLIVLDNQGKVLNQVDQIKGLQNNTVLCLYQDVDQNVWMGLDLGISYMNLDSPIRTYQDSKGLIGSVYAAAISYGNLYLGTNQGLFYKTLDAPSEFRFIEGTQGQVWSLQTIGTDLFCGHHTGTFQIKGDKVSRIASVQGTWKIASMEDFPDLLLQGNYDGLYVLEKEGETWRLRNKLKGFDHSARYFETFGNVIFVNHEYKGIFKLNVDQHFSKVLKVDIDTAIKGSNSGIVKYKGDVWYAYKEGIFKYNWEQSRFAKDSVLSKLYTPADYVSGKLVVDTTNKYLWSFSNNHIGYVSEGKLANDPIINKIPLTQNMRDGIIGYESAMALKEQGMYLFGSRSGYLTIDLNEYQEAAYGVNINKLRKAGKNRSETEKSLLSITRDGTFDSTENSLEFFFNVTSYTKYLTPQYQYRLSDIYPNWSEWSPNASVLFENLPSGTYEFAVRAKIGNKLTTNQGIYRFKISKPWYRSNLFLMLYVIGGILGCIAIHRSYRSHYNKRQQKLIAENQREMALAKAKNDKEIIKIKNEQLKEEFKSKSNELAASTMSIIKKNELLSNIKNQLVTDIDDKGSVKHIIHIIDKNLNQNDDWELFKEAFNNADRKFLKKLKKAHPNLSPNDIRLCAYLRLNLSSKEIAPLFNISPRSVEIKRYRLRKKMNLEHDDNLVDYILTL